MRRLVASPGAWHILSLAAGLAVILVLQSTQWFFFDEWAFIELDGAGLMAPHVGHWSLSPTLICDAFRSVFGLGSYLPYAAAMTLAHLAAAHLIWRIMMRAGSNPWIATASTVVFIFLGTGGENILWAFQIGFVGALVFGLLAFYLAMTEKISTPRLALVTAIALVSLTWSGTSIPVVVATAILLLARSGWRRALVFVAITGAVYLAWYFAFQGYNGPDTGGFAPYKLAVLVPQFIGIMLVFGFGDVFPVPFLGFAILLAIAVWLVRLLVTKRDLRFAYPALALGAAAAVFAFMSAYSRATMAVGAGRASRYVYLLVLLLLPLIALAITRLVRDRMPWLIGSVVALLALAGFQGVVLVNEAARQSAIELGSDRALSAALQLYVDETPGIQLDAVPDPQWAPDITMRELIALYDGGYLPIDDFGPKDLADVESRVVITP